MEARLVALVQADDLADIRIPFGHLRRVLSEQLDPVRGVDERPRLERIDREHHVDAALLRLRDRPVEKGLIDDRRRLRGIPEDGHPVLGHAELRQHREESGAAVLRVLAGVVGDAEGRARRRARKGQRRARARESRSNLPHA